MLFTNALKQRKEDQKMLAEVNLVNHAVSPLAVCTFARLGPLRQQIKGSKRDSEAGGLHSRRRLKASPQLAAELSDALQGGAALVLHPHQGHQEGHQRAEDDTQQRAPSSEDTAAGVTPHRHSSHDVSRLNSPSSSDTVPHVYPPQLWEPKGGWQGGKHGQHDSWESLTLPTKFNSVSQMLQLVR